MKYFLAVIILFFPIISQADVDLPAKSCVDNYQTVEVYETCMKNSLPRDEEAMAKIYQSIITALPDEKRQGSFRKTQDQWYESMFKTCTGMAVPEHMHNDVYNMSQIGCLDRNTETRILQLDKILKRCQSNIPGDVVKCNSDIKTFAPDADSM